jgi:hypothetical protein
MTATAPRFAYPKKLYSPVDACVYCGEKGGLSTEHIIPLAFGGELILPKASCEAHRKVTSRVEDFILRRYLCPLRSHLGLPSRRPTLRPDGYPLKLSRNGQSWKKKVSLKDHPGFFRFMLLDRPGKVAGRPRIQATYSISFVHIEIFSDIRQRLARLGADSFEDAVTINALHLARFLAKIGHAFAVAELGIEVFEEFYVTRLIDGDATDWNYWVGSYDQRLTSTPNVLHELEFFRRGDDLSVILHLLAPLTQGAAHEVIVGRLKPNVDLPSASSISARIDPKSETNKVAVGGLI